ncbi:MAG: choice-of-anchor Q domain-containing protein, partial [Anaerolineales bacterium]
MFTTKSISGVFSTLLITVSILALTFGVLGVTPAWAATVRYATPTGAGDCASWATACTLQTALTNAGNGDEIWVAAGTHKPTTGADRTVTFQLKAVAVYGGFAGTETARDQRNFTANVTILSGEIGAAGVSDNSYHVVTGADGATLDGFTITAGNANGSTSDYHGGGMYNEAGSLTLTNIIFSGNSAANGGGGMYNTSNPTLTNVTFSGNSAADGGGMYTNVGSSPTLMDVIFSGNSATACGGGMETYSSSPTLTNVTFSDNSATSAGGGMYNNASNATLMNVAFNGNSAGNDGGGMWNFNNTSTLTNVTFSGNWATHVGGGMLNYYTGSPTLTNVTFSGNWASLGGGIWNESSSPTLTNITFAANAATNGGGMYNNNGGNPAIRNTIFWGNLAITAGAQIYNNSSTPVVSDSVVQGGCPAGSACVNIITASPMLGPLWNYGGYTETVPLWTYSSAIDAGSDLVCPAADQRGVTRPQGAHCDIGAYEYGMDANTPTPTVTPTPTATHTPTMTITPTLTVTQTPPITQTFTSIAAQDGWILESSETSNLGGTMNSVAATFNLGDNAAKKQYRSILSFDTGAILPDNAVITGVTLKVKQQAIVGGGNPVATFQGFMADIQNGTFGTAALQTGDFQAASSKMCGPYLTALSGGWYSINLIGAGPFVNKLATNSGLTQIRLRFKLDDTNDAVANYLSLYSGNAPTG